ncbi:hypothetical protein [Geminisphaera colitermitum]|uniref:hypothetical protein n=1 Tax=Geminisphaera colitermitum TaxID=1148786 RepID=UPI000158D05F|nr:hypothetical protein [Geminisphaera colitermitum]
MHPKDYPSLIRASIASLALLAAGTLAAHASDTSATPQHLDDAPDTTRSLRRLDAAFSGVVPWIQSLADEKTGGFFETTGLKQGREDRPYEADIQSTYFAVLMLNDAGQLATLPPARKDALVHFFQSRQDPETGYFSDPAYPEMKDNTRTMGRALLFSVNGLRHLGAKPLHPLPGERRPKDTKPATAGISLSFIRKTTAAATASPTVPAHLASADAFRKWLDERPWDNAWTALDQLSSQARLIRAQEPVLQRALVDEALRNVRARQNPDTGLVKGGPMSVRLSGAFKFVSFCNNVGRPIPFAAQLRKSTVAWYRSQPVTDKIFFIRNAAEMLASLVRQTGHPLAPAELRDVIDTSLIELERYRCPDGAFSSFVGRYYISPNDLWLSPRRVARAGPQSDMNGTANAWAMRKALHRLAGSTPEYGLPPSNPSHP